MEGSAEANGDLGQTVHACQSSKIQTHIRAPLERFSVPQRQFDHIHVDLVGPLPPSNGFTHLLTVVNRFSCWPEAIPLNDTTATGCAQALASHWIARFGIPIDVIRQRCPIHLTAMDSYCPVVRYPAPPHHSLPPSALRTRLTGPIWTQELQWVLLGIRTAPKEDLGCSSAEMVYGAPLTVPGDFIPNHSISDNNLQLQHLRD